jgi:hypothetical protein
MHANVLQGSWRILTRDRPILLREIRDSEMEKGHVGQYLSKLGDSGLFFSGGRRIDAARFRDFPNRKPWEVTRHYVFVPGEQA